MIELSVLRIALATLILSLLVLKTEVYPHQFTMGSFVDSSVGEPGLVKSWIFGPDCIHDFAAADIVRQPGPFVDIDFEGQSALSPLSVQKSLPWNI